MLQRALLLLTFLTAPMLAQITAFPKPSYFRQTFSTPDTKILLQPPARLGDFVVPGKDGKQIELRLKDYLDLVMANNTDIATQRLSIEVPRNNILRQSSIFDPLATARWTTTKANTPAIDTVQRAQTLSTMTQPANFTFSQLAPTGTNYQVQFFGQRYTTNAGVALLNPALNTSLAITATQPLLKNRGGFITRLGIMTAKSRYRTAEYNLKNALIGLFSDSENAYWDVVLARENLRVQESARELAVEALKQAQKELDLGAMSPLDIYNPQQNLATAEIGVSQARFTLLQREDALRKQIGADLSPDYRTLPIVLTESVTPPSGSDRYDTEAAIEKALRLRPDLKAAAQNLDVDDLQIRQATNNLKPDLSLVGGYTSQGVGGNGILGAGGLTAGGFGDSLGQLFSFGFPVYYGGIQLRLPIRNRAASADLADALLSKKNDTLAFRNTQQVVRLDILTAINQVESAKASVRLAKVALEFAQKYLDAERKKYELGTSQIFFVLQAQQALVSAESTVVQNSISYRRNLLNLSRRTGDLLEERGITIQ